MSEMNNDPRPVLFSRPQHLQHLSLRHIPVVRSQQKPDDALVVDQTPQPQLASMSAPRRPETATSRNRRHLHSFPEPPWLGTPLAPPSCVFDPLSLECTVPTPVPLLPPSPPHVSESITHRDAVLVSFIMGMVAFALILICYFLVRPYRATRRQVIQLTQQQQQQQQDSAEPVLSEAERKSQIQANMKLLQTDDILGDANSCSICLGDFVKGDSISGSLNPDCQHYFHTDCILQAFLQRPKSHECPVCRRDFFAEATSSAPSEPTQG
jgi:hypothetical protein